MPSVAFITLGCKVNIYESNVLMKRFKENGYEIVDPKEVSDVYVINTCSVTNMADSKSRKMIRQCQRTNPNAIICVMGCYAQTNPEAQTLEGIDILIGNKEKEIIVNKVEEALKGAPKFTYIVNMRQQREYDLMEATEFDHTRAFIKIEDGCNNFCSYCIIPFARGPIRSKRAKDVIEEMKKIAQMGYKEVVLSGIETGSYESNGLRLSDLIELILQEVPLIERIRISSIEMTTIDDKMIDLIKNNSVIASHLHLPLQSGNAKILKLMNRKYTPEEFYQMTLKLKEARKDLSITTDVIAGFPGETDEDFKDTLEFIKKVGFSALHVFPYSKRNGTAAAKMKQVNDSVKKQRALELIALSEELNYEYNKKFLNTIQRVIIEQKFDESYMVGHTSNYLKVFIPLDEKLIKEMVDVEIINVEKDKIIGKIKIF
ncbi:MAG: tRNA (N(6)-L-threonylcarbamoyladenosine(37)-C(2))-methylthiotransferase MtaB [Anaeroplasmataceae bacterium]